MYTCPTSVYPPIPPRPSVPSDWRSSADKLFHKGIEAGLRTVELLRQSGLDCRLSVVGMPEKRLYAAPTLAPDADALLTRLSSLKWVEHHPSLTNAKVKELFWNSHIHLFPTIDKSLGWVAVEAGLCGAATATTNVFALPELVRNGTDGWLAPLPLDENRR